MMRKMSLILLLAVFACPVFSQNTDSIPAKEASQHYNESIKIYGTVSGGRHIEQSFITLINVDGNYPPLAQVLARRTVQ